MSSRSLIYPALALALACTSPAQAQSSDAAKVAFKKLDDYLQKNPVDFETSFDAQSDGNELYRGKGHFIIRQPNALRADTTLGHNTYVVVSDGSVLTIFNPQDKRYSQNAAPQSLPAAFGFFTGEIGIDSQVLNFMSIVHDVVASGDIAKVTDSGSDVIDGKSCDKFTVSEASGDDTWQVWLEKGDTPLICKLVYKSVDGPAQSNTFHWNAAPTLTAETFTFSPPAGSTKVDIGDLNMVSP